MIEIKNILEVEKHLEGIKVVIFDLDDTLYSEKEYVKSGFDAISLLYPQIRDFSHRLWNAFVEGRPAIDFVLAEENLIVEKERCLVAYRNHFPKITLYHGVKEMIERLKINKKIAIITDGRPEGQKAKIEALHLIELVDKLLITDELGDKTFRKPNTKPFEIMRDYFKCEYREMIYIGDNPSKDFIGPEKLGMRYIFFRNTDGLYNK